MIEEINNQDFMTMDLYTKKSLELTENSKDHEKYGSLFWLLDMTKSAMGARLLKNYIDRPLLKKEAIEERLDIVEIFTQQFIQRESIKEILKEIYDLERLSSRIAFGNINARDLKWIASSLKVLPELKQQLYSFNEPLTDQLANQIIDLSHITKLIDDAIIDNPPLTIKEGKHASRSSRIRSVPCTRYFNICHAVHRKSSVDQFHKQSFPLRWGCSSRCHDDHYKHQPACGDAGSGNLSGRAANHQL